MTALLIDLFLLGLMALGVYASRYLYSTYLATTTGIERHGPMGGAQRISWRDTDRLSTLHLFRGLTCVHARDGGTIVIPKGLPRYEDFVALVASKRPDLGAASAQIGVQLAGWTWRTVVAAIGCAVIAYCVLRLAYIRLGPW